MIITIPNKSAFIPKQKYDVLTNGYGSASTEFLDYLEQQNVYKLNNVTAVLESIEKRSNCLKNLSRTITHKTTQNDLGLYQQYSIYLSRFINYYVSLNLNNSITSNSDFLISNFFQVFTKPISNQSAQFGYRITNSDGYKYCDGLEFKDIYKMWSTSGSPEAFYEVIKELINENKINSVYLYANASEEEIKTLIQNQDKNLRNKFEINENNTALTVKAILNTVIDALKYLSNFIYAYALSITKDSLVLELSDSLNAAYGEGYNYFDISYDFSGQNQGDMIVDQFDLTSVKFENLNYINIGKSDTEKEYKLIKKYTRYSASNAKQITTKNNIPVFSLFPKEWLDTMSINYCENHISFEPQIKISNLYAKINYSTNIADVSTLSDFSFVGDYNVYNCRNKTSIDQITDQSGQHLQNIKKAFYKDVEKINLKETFLQSLVFTSNKIKALILNNFTSGNQPFNIEIKQLTKTQLLNSNNAFVPVAFKTTRINQLNAEKEEIYFVSLVNFSTLPSFRKFTKSQKYLQYLNNLIENNCLHDPTIFDQILAKRFGNTIKYNLANQEVYQKLGDEFILALIEKDIKEMQVINGETLAFLNGTLNIDNTLVSKLKTLKEKEQIILNKYTEEDRCFSNLIDANILNDKYIEDDQAQLQLITARLNERIQLKQGFPERIRLQEKALEDQKKLFNSISSEVQKISNAQNEAKKNAIQNKEYSPDTFFVGLKTRGIYIKEINYEDSNDNTLNFNSSNFECFRFEHIESLTLKSVTFIVNKPFQIKVDGDAANIIYAGPMKVEVTESSISVAALNSSTILGFIDERNCMVHPHSSPMSFNNRPPESAASDFYSYRRGCLGESSPYIYNAFKSTSSLKNVLVNAFIWLSSANSSDHWGRNYKFFPRYGSTSLVNLDQEAVDLIAVNQYIESQEPIAKPKKQCEHEYEDGECIHCGLECIDHNYDYDGYCSTCGHYNSSYDDSENDEDEEEQTPQETPQPLTYTPYSPLTNNNN